MFEYMRVRTLVFGFLLLSVTVTFLNILVVSWMHRFRSVTALLCTSWGFVTLAVKSFFMTLSKRISTYSQSLRADGKTVISLRTALYAIWNFFVYILRAIVYLPVSIQQAMLVYGAIHDDACKKTERGNVCRGRKECIDAIRGYSHIDYANDMRSIRRNYLSADKE